MPLDNGNSLNVNGSVKGRGVNLRHLSTAQRITLAANAWSGDLWVHDFSKVQVAQLFNVPAKEVAREIEHRRADKLSAAVAYLVSVWTAADPNTRIEAIKAIGPKAVRDALRQAV
jgi:hypothetical protein